MTTSGHVQCAKPFPDLAVFPSPYDCEPVPEYPEARTPSGAKYPGFEARIIDWTHIYYSPWGAILFHRKMFAFTRKLLI
jgi:hypothetical protein